MEGYNSNSKNNRFFRLRCSVQSYDWGNVGEKSLVGRLFSLNPGSGIIDPYKPYAEFWMGSWEPMNLDHHLSMKPVDVGRLLVSSLGSLEKPMCSAMRF